MRCPLASLDTAGPTHTTTPFLFVPFVRLNDFGKIRHVVLQGVCVC